MKFSILISIVCLGLYIIVLTSYLEYDLKKIAAVTTCIAMTWLWLETVNCTATAILFALVHASYKSALFILLGVYYGTYVTQDLRNLCVTYALDSVCYCYLVICFSTGPPGTFYIYIKSSMKMFLVWDGVLNNNFLSIIKLLFKTNWIVLWCLLLLALAICYGKATLAPMSDTCSTLALISCTCFTLPAQPLVHATLPSPLCYLALVMSVTCLPPVLPCLASMPLMTGTQPVMSSTLCPTNGYALALSPYGAFSSGMLFRGITRKQGFLVIFILPPG